MLLARVGSREDVGDVSPALSNRLPAVDCNDETAENGLHQAQAAAAEEQPPPLHTEAPAEGCGWAQRLRQLVLDLVDGHPNRLWVLQCNVALLALLPLALFMGSRDQCGASALLPGQAGMLQAGAILRILEIVAHGLLVSATFPWPAATVSQTISATSQQPPDPMTSPSSDCSSRIGAVLETLRSVWDLERRAAVCRVIAVLALASSASSSWSFTAMTMTHLSMYSSCTCRAWSCSTTLGGHSAASALFWIAVSLFIAFVWLRVCVESRLMHHFVGPHVRSNSLWQRATLSNAWRLRVGRAVLSVAVGSLLLSLVIYLGVLMASSCRMDDLMVSYGLVFAVLLYLLMLVMLLLEWSGDVYGEAVEDPVTAVRPYASPEVAEQ